VGFRPFVARAAAQAGISGFVCNTPAGVVIEGQGNEMQLASFERDLRHAAPPAARIDRIDRFSIDLDPTEHGFTIRVSEASAPPTAAVTPDLAVCDACLAEMRNPDDDRRYRHPLINCTNCGPRYSILRRIPYDRANTTMAEFAMCPACRDEYHTPTDRRYHAQPTLCHECGPQVRLIDLHCVGLGFDGDPVFVAADLLAEGHILAIKGIGGYHLACRADDEAAVATLRSRKHRLHKPFAVMVASLDVARRYAALTPSAEAQLTSPARPIVLAPRTAECNFAPSVAPDNHRVGLMLPYTPLHHLLFDDAAGRFDALVMTSANDTDEPLVYEDDCAVAMLSPLADVVLTHDRPIQRPVDDSVMLARRDGGITPIRRSRGFVPAAVRLPFSLPTPGICMGADLKSAVAVVRGDEVICSQHLGDLQNARAHALLRRTVDDLCSLMGVTPQWIARDRHPGYFSTQLAGEIASELVIEQFGVQHHHAHAAAVLAEHGITEPALAIVCDGTGYGNDDTIWGGEMLQVHERGFVRQAHLVPIRLPGGDAAVRQPWRSALAWLHHACEGHIPPKLLDRLYSLAPREHIEFVLQMLDANARCMVCTSAGRLFDAAAALCGLAAENLYEGYAPCRLETAAWSCQATLPDEALYQINGRGPMAIDFSPLILELAETQAGPAWSAALFHDQFVRAWAEAACLAMQRPDLSIVALSGGVFCNEWITTHLVRRLEERGATVLVHQQLPPNDGGIAYGQAAVMAAAMCA